MVESLLLLSHYSPVPSGHPMAHNAISADAHMMLTLLRLRPGPLFYGMQGVSYL